MSPWESFVLLFQSTNMLTVCLWVTGFILFCVEFFQPMHGVAYCLGMTLMGGAFVTRMVYGSAGEAFSFVFVTCVLLFGIHIVSMFTNKRGWLNVARIERVGERTRRYGTLIDRIGVAITDINPTGNVTIGDVNLVVSSESPITRGDNVRITKIAQDKITVERVERDGSV